MKNSEARNLLGFPPNSRPSLSQIKAAYKSKVWDVHPDRFPVDRRTHAETQFKMISEAYACLLTVFQTCYAMHIACRVKSNPESLIYSGGRSSQSASYTRVVRTGVPKVHKGAGHHPLVGLPFLFIILGTVGLGSLSVARAY